MLVYKENDVIKWVIPVVEESEVFKEFMKNNIHFVVTHDVIENQNFLNAYTCDFSLPCGSYSPIVFNVELAKPIFISYLRSARDPLLKDLDVQFMRALEIGDTVKMQEIGVKKQELRDVTEIDLSSAIDLDTLKILWPTSVLGNCPF